MRGLLLPTLILAGLGLPAAPGAEAPGGVAVVLDEPGMPVRGAGSSATVVGRILQGAGLQVRPFSARQLADPKRLDPAAVDLVLLPGGQSFPVEARESLVRFLRGGGALITLGGYAFENLLREHEGQWYDQAAYEKLNPNNAAEAARLFRPMNTARGTPKNELKLEPEQIGMFDACFPLKRACRLTPNADQRIVRGPCELHGVLEGWAASGIVGDYENNGIDFLKCKIATNARWVPLLDTFDRFGRARGAAAALLLNFNGHYAGSNWAYFGIENRDLFQDPAGPGAKALQDIARFLVRGTYLQSVTLPNRLLRPQQPLTVDVAVRNAGRRAQSVRLQLGAGPASVSRPLNLKPGEVRTIAIELPRPADEPSLGQVVATLLAGDEPVDGLATGYVVEQPELIRSGADLRFAGNYFTRNGRPMFLFGTDETAYVYLTPHENPLTWSRDLLAARDVGMNLYENLQYSRPGHEMLPADWGNFRAMAQLTQQYNLVFMPGMLIVHNVAVGDAEIAAESRQCEGYARLLADVPGVLHYLNGDCVYRPDLDDPEMTRLWNEWRRLAHGDAAPQEIPRKISARWDDPAAIDLVRFSQWMTARWNRAHVAAIRRADAVHPITSECGQSPYGGIHLRRTIGEQDVANTNLFLPVEAVPATLRWNDLRTRGKGLTVGEFGMQAHPAWRREGGPSHGYAMPQTERQQSRLFTSVAAYALGLGGAKIQNWCLRDAQHRSVHPWGIFYADGLVPKDVAYVHRNLSMIWRHFTPRDVAPPLSVCIPLELGQGNERSLECAVAYRAFSTLFELHHDFNVFDDENLDTLGPATKALVYPSPFAVSDRAYERLLSWVRAGGTLLVTGDFSFDESRRRTRTARLEELAGVRFVAEKFPNVARKSGASVRTRFAPAGSDPLLLTPCLAVAPARAEVLGAGPQGEPIVVRHRVGRGTVWYATDPLELSLDPVAADGRRRLYAAVLDSLPLAPLSVEPNEPWLQVMAQPTAHGKVHVVVNTRPGTSSARATLATAAGPVALGARDGWPAMAAVTDDGRLVAALGDGHVAVAGTSVSAGSGMGALLALDGRDLRSSDAFLVAPWEPGEVVLPGSGERVAIVGDFRAGEWVAFERLPAHGRAPRVAIDADRATCMILVCRPADAARWQQQLGIALCHPERIQGY